jgi:hypothetical protein
MKKNLLLGVALLGALTVSSAQADDSATFGSGKWSVGMGVSTLGIGANVAYKFNESFKVRGVVNYFRLSRKFSDDETAIDAKLRFLTVGALGDWHMMQNGFRVTGGLVYNGNRLNITGKLTRNLTINGRTYTPAEIGEAKGTLDFRKIAPYLGIGYDSGHEKKAGFSFTADAGVLFQGKIRGKVDSISGLAVNKAQAISDAKDDIVNTANKSRWLKTYPVISLGLSYKF